MDQLGSFSSSSTLFLSTIIILNLNGKNMNFCFFFVCFRNGAQLQEDCNPQPGLSLRLQLCHAVPQVRTTRSLQSFCVLLCCVCAGCAVVHSNCSVSCCRYAFSKNNQPTMLPKPNPNVPFGSAKEMSHNDIARLNTLYKCCECPHEHIMNIYAHTCVSTVCLYIELLANPRLCCLLLQRKPPHVLTDTSEGRLSACAQ